MAPQKQADKADQMEKVAAELASAVFERRKRMLDSVGKRPFLGQALSPEEMLGEYLKIRHDALGWSRILQTESQVSKDGVLLLRKDFVEKVRELEAKLKEGEQNATQSVF